MNMTGNNGIFGVPAEHYPGLIALIATPFLLGAGLMLVRWRTRAGSKWAQRLSARLGGLSLPAKVAVVAMIMGAAVHGAVVPTHWGETRVLAILFGLDTLGFVAAATWTILGRRHWQLASAAMLGGTVAGYAFYLAKGWETADLVGMAVSLIELAGFFVLVLAGHTAFADPARRRRLLASSFGASAALVAGMVAATGTVAATGSVALASSDVHDGASMGTMGAGTSKTAHADNAMSAMSSAQGSPTTTMPGMGTAGTGTDTSSAAMPEMSSAGSSGGMTGMPASVATTTSGMPAMGSPAGSSGNSGPGTGMGGMGGMGGTGSGPTPLSLATTSPAGNITWPLSMGAMGAGMQMVTPNCNTEPASQPQSAAVSLVNQTVAALAPFESLTAAKAAGYVPITPSGAPVVHYANPAYLASSQTLDPGAIESLVYANTSRGAILVAAMYAMANNQVGQTPPMPGGCLTEWHVHTNLCFSNTSGVVVGVEHNGVCAAGSTNHVTQPMIHVWLAPIPGGPLAVDASDAQVVAAAANLPAPNPPNPTA